MLFADKQPRPTIAAPGQARYDQICDDRCIQANCRADKQRAEKGCCPTGTWQFRVVDEGAHPGKDAKKANESADEGSHDDY